MIYRVVVAFMAVVIGIVLWLSLAMVWGTLVGTLDPLGQSIFPDVWAQWREGPIAMIGNFIDSWYAGVLFAGVVFYLFVSAQKREPMWGYEP